MKELKPKIYKYKKYHNNMIVNKLIKSDFKHFKLKIGIIGLKAVKASVVNTLQISASIKGIAKDCKKKYKLWLYCFPNMSITSKSISVRMGKGVGALKEWIFVIKKNQIFIELKGKYKNLLLKSLIKMKKKIPIESIIVDDVYKKKWKRFKDLI